MSGAENARRRLRHEGPTEQEYKADHPNVDWSTHEVMFRIVNGGNTRRDGYILTRIDGHRPRDFELEAWLRTRQCEAPGDE